VPRREIIETLTYLGLIADGELSVPVNSTYRLDDYRRAFEHAQASRRGGKVLFTLD
jgi:NADPH:quinone reductase-like Zn-dependent oxidoreductase